MPLFSPIVTSFNGGELSRRMEGRVDTAIYPIGLAEMFNFVPSVEGPAVKSPGFRYIRAAMASAAWLSAFLFSRTQAYVIEWGEAALRFYTNGGRIEDGGGAPYEVAVPYAAAEAPFVSAQQSYDRLYLAHESHAPAALTRTGAVTFAFAALELAGGPFADTNTNEAVTVAATASSGDVTLYASGGDVWEAGHVGSLFRIETRDYAEIPQWEPGVTVESGALRSSDNKVYLRVGGTSRTGHIQPTHGEGVQWDGTGSGTDINGEDAGGVQWQYVHDAFGIVLITGYAGPREVTGTVVRRLPNSAAAANAYDGPIGYVPPYSGGTVIGGRTYFDLFSIEATGPEPEYSLVGDDYVPPSGSTSYTAPGSWRWAHSAISDAAGWPRVVLLAWGRLIFFTDFEIIASVVGDYGGGRVNFAEFGDGGLPTADMAFRLRLSISNPVLWAREDRGAILVGTADGEYLIGAINAAAAVSAGNIQCVKQTRHGAAPVWPIDAGGETIFVQRGGRKLRQAAYSLERDKYLADNITIWCRHVLGDGCAQLAFEQESEEMLWALRADGVLAAHPHAPEQEIKGFARRAHAAGPILSIVSIPAEDGGLDQLWALIENEATGAKSVELRAPWWVEGEADEPPADTLARQATAFFVDSGVTVEAPASTTLTGLTWLAGRKVDALADGSVLRDLAVSAAGAVTLPLPQAPAIVHVGLRYEARLTPMRPEARGRDGGTVQGRRKRVVAMIARVLESLGLKVRFGATAADGEPREEALQERPDDTALDRPPALFSGDTPRRGGGNWGTDGQATIVHDDPLPCILIATMPSVEVTE
jgi:hypothetical protein